MGSDVSSRVRLPIRWWAKSAEAKPPPTGRLTGSSTPSAAPATSRPASRSTASTLHWWRAIEITVAVVGDASNDEIQFAEQGRGAWATGQGDGVSWRTSAQSQTIAVESGLAAGSRREHAARFAHDAIRGDRWDIRNLSSTLSLSYVSAGRLAAYALFSGRHCTPGPGPCSLPRREGASRTSTAPPGPFGPTRSLPARTRASSGARRYGGDTTARNTE